MNDFDMLRAAPYNTCESCGRVLADDEERFVALRPSEASFQDAISTVSCTACINEPIAVLKEVDLCMHAGDTERVQEVIEAFSDKVEDWDERTFMERDA